VAVAPRYAQNMTTCKKNAGVGSRSKLKSKIQGARYKTQGARHRKVISNCGFRIADCGIKKSMEHIAWDRGRKVTRHRVRIAQSAKRIAKR